MRNIVTLLLACMMLLWVMSPALPAPSFGTAFSYQGKVTGASGAPVSGLADFRFSLWDSVSGGAQIGATVPYDGVNVVGGLFTVALDFGSGPFTGQARWLETDFRMVGDPSFNTLAPPALITANPYSIYALTALNAGDASTLNGQNGAYYLNAGNLIAGTITDGRLSTNVMLLNNTQTVTGAKTFSSASNSFTGNGSGLTGLNATNLGSGTVPDARLSSNVATLNTIQTFTAEKRFSGKVGIGVASASYPLHVENPSNVNFSRAIYGAATSTGTGQQLWGVYGRTDSTASSNPGAGVFGYASAVTGSSAGVRGDSNSPDGWGGYFRGRGYFSDNVGIGDLTPTSRLTVADSNSVPTLDVTHSLSSNDQPAILGTHAVTDGKGIGVKGVGGYIGVFGTSVSGTGVWGASTSGLAGYFSGDVHVSGTLSKIAGSFKIDHPLDPANKYLYHSFVESPDMKNIYDGNTVTDSNGDATVVLPAYFEALNKDFRYQLTVIGQFAQAIIAEKINGSQFKIKTDKPNVEVSWQVTGIRQDAYANAHRIQVEEDKPANEIGKYQYPELYGKGVESAIDRPIAHEEPAAAIPRR